MSVTIALNRGIRRRCGRRPRADLNQEDDP
jgi:hypothetical protein